MYSNHVNISFLTFTQIFIFKIEISTIKMLINSQNQQDRKLVTWIIKIIHFCILNLHFFANTCCICYDNKLLN